MKKFIAKHYSLILFIAFLSLGSAAVITQINESQVKNLVSDLAGKAPKDANGNVAANSFIPNFSSTVSSATPIVLTIASPQFQESTGSANQVYTLPVVSSSTLGLFYLFTNSGSGTVTIQSSGGNTIASLLNGNSVFIWCVLPTGTGLASWDRGLMGGSFSGTAGGVPLTTGATMNTLSLTGTTTTAALTAGASTITAGVFANTKAGLGTTAQAGVSLTNSTNATVGTQNQYGLDLTWTYSAWNTGGTPAANQQQFTIEPRGITGATTGGNIFFKYQNNGGGYVDTYQFGSNGTFSLLTGGLGLKGVLVSALPSAASSTGVEYYVTDATSPAMGSTVAGGGSAKAKVWSNGTNWTVTGI